MCPKTKEMMLEGARWGRATEWGLVILSLHPADQRCGPARGFMKAHAYSKSG
jgi:hypothetical protein